ncbi:MAG: hypothetical protein IJC71_00495 [Clostridia bacterium]|nr:hypothetical protein [Clostridia bacterium]
MYKIIRSLWLGNCRPGERYVDKRSEYWRLQKRQTELIDQLSEKLNEEEKEILEKIVNLSIEMMSMDEEEVFISAFRLGAGMTAEVFTDCPGPFCT